MSYLIKREIVRLAAAAAIAALPILTGCNAQNLKPVAADRGFSALGEPQAELAYATAMPSASVDESVARGDLAMARGDSERALFEYLQALQAGGANVDVLYKVGQIHLARGDKDRAEIAFSMALVEQPDHAGLRLELGILRMHKRDYATAKRHLLKALEIAGENARARNALGVMEDMAGHYDQAQAHYQAAIAVAADRSTSMNNLGYSHYLSGDLEKAEASFRAALGVDPENQRAWRNLGLVLARQARYPEALQAFGKTGKEYEAYNDVGYIAMVAGHYDAAERFFEEAIIRSPAYYALAGKNAQRLAVMRTSGAALE